VPGIVAYVSASAPIFAHMVIWATILGTQCTVCAKDYGLHDQNIDMIILFACLVGWLESSLVEIKNKNKEQSLRKLLGLMLSGVNIGMALAQ